jgi:hypothetical protein
MGMIKTAMEEQTRRRLSNEYLRNAVREEMLAGLMMGSYRFATLAEMPQTVYQQWVNLNDKVLVEAAAIDTSQSLVDVGEPVESELKELFEKYKEIEPGPVMLGGVELPRSTPAFGVPRKVVLHYLRANPEAFREAIAAEISDEEVAKFYEENKALYPKNEFDFDIDEDGGEPETPTDTPPEGETATPEASGDMPPEEAADEADSGSESAESDAEATGDTAESQPSEPMPEEPAAEEPAAEEPAPENPEAGEEPAPQAVQPARLPVQFVSMLQEEADPQESSDNGAAAAMSDESGAAEASADEAPPADDSATADEADAFKLEYKPLEEVADEIRRNLAAARVADKVQEMADQAYTDLAAEFRDYQGAVLDAEGAGKPAPTPPATLTDLSAIAQKYGLEYEKSEPLSIYDLRDMPLGASIETVRTGGQSVQSFLGSVVFSDLFDDHEPIRTMTFDDNQYVVLRTRTVPAEVPKFEDVREQVVEAWRKQKATEIAAKRAEELAEKAAQADVSLKDYFADNPAIEVIEPAAFAKFTQSEIDPQTLRVDYQLSAPEGIVAAGPEFIDKVFEAAPGDVVAIKNYDGSQVYVVRIKSHLQTPEQLRESFLAEINTDIGRLTLSQQNAGRAQQQLNADLFETKKIDWKADLTESEE